MHRWKILLEGLCNRTTPSITSSDVLIVYLRQRKHPDWTAFYMPKCQAQDDLWGKSHFNFTVDEVNYHVLRTGAFPFIKFHCTRRPVSDLSFEDNFYKVLKCLNLGIPTVAYGIAGLLWTKHVEVIPIKGQKVHLFFWYKEDECH